MIRLTRLRSSNPLYINPDHIEKLEQHHETIVQLFNGDEFVVTESAERIVDLIIEQRARILARASTLAADTSSSSDVTASSDAPVSSDLSLSCGPSYGGDR